MNTFKDSLEKFESSIKNIKRHNINLGQKGDIEKSLYDFKEKKTNYYLNLYRTSFAELRHNCAGLIYLEKIDKSNEMMVVKINELMKEIENDFNQNNVEKMEEKLKEIRSIYNKLKLPKELEKLDFKVDNIPTDIKSDVKADLDELGKCFYSGCYRSAVILCGRLLETALHRKYYEVTKNDLLEKSPGIGLGNLIAKLKDRKVRLDPGIANQIHLVNQIRVHSVHIKKEAFYPTKGQTQAMILYTLDILEKLFG